MPKAKIPPGPPFPKGGAGVLKLLFQGGRWCFEDLFSKGGDGVLKIFFKREEIGALELLFQRGEMHLLEW
ncbi:MAG: hypothetical protein C4519_13740 [Desulfobacteraceae bacterium]|nr:MAG: hypothetical protein C4519_13740 [Desulfobacteraceae bacterium]